MRSVNAMYAIAYIFSLYIFISFFILPLYFQDNDKFFYVL